MSNADLAAAVRVARERLEAARRAAEAAETGANAAWLAVGEAEAAYDAAEGALSAALRRERAFDAGPGRYLRLYTRLHAALRRIIARDQAAGAYVAGTEVDIDAIWQRWLDWAGVVGLVAPGVA
jgi:hypothetical protein